VKIYSLKLFLGRLLICLLVGAWIFYTEKMFWMIAHLDARPHDIPPCMIILHFFYALFVFGFGAFLKHIEGWMREFFDWAARKPREAIFWIVGIIIFFCTQRIMMWSFRFKFTGWGYEDNAILTVCVLGVGVVGIVVVCCRKAAIENTKKGLLIFWKWITAEKEADIFVDKV
jgi:hypothetical protein